MALRTLPLVKPEPPVRRGILIEVVGPPGAGKTRTVQEICTGMPRNLRTQAISNDACRETISLLRGFPWIESQVAPGHPARRMLFGAALHLLNEAADILLGENDVVVVGRHVGFYLAMELAGGRAGDLEWACRDIREPDLTLFLDRPSLASNPQMAAETQRLCKRAGRELNQLVCRNWVRLDADGRTDEDVANECVRQIVGALQSRALKG